MSLLTRLSNLFTRELDAYAFEKTVYASVDDYVHDGGCIITTIYVPSYEIYAHYYNDMKEFIPYKSEKTFEENCKDCKNIRKIKISTSFVSYLCDFYEIREEHKKWCDKNKEYFEGITIVAQKLNEDS